jgi:ABC-2 type transport system permease protein
MAAVMRLETQHLLRDRPTLGLILLVPAVQLLLFGGTVDLDPHGLRLALAYPSGMAIEDTRRTIAETGYFDTIIEGHAPGHARGIVLAGKADIGLELRSDASPAIIADASDASAVRPAALALSIALQRETVRNVAALFGVADTDELIASGAARVEWLYNPVARTSWSLIPGLIGVVIMISMLMLGALTLVREREQGHWESLLASPVDGCDVLAGKLAPYALLAVMQAALVTGAGHLFFDVPVRGPLSLLLFAALLLAVCHLLLGFALSALASTQLQAIQMAVFFYLPSMLLSGFMFPFKGMPRWAQCLGECLPLTHFVRIARAVLLRGAGLGNIAAELWPIAIFAFLAGGLALLAWRRHLM